jgi:hypothetical protein
MNETETTQRLDSLKEHQEFLQQVLKTARERVLIVSPYISISAIESDNIPTLVRQAVSRGVQVQVFVDSCRNCYTDGTMKDRAMDGIAELVMAGAQVGVVNGISSNCLARDSNLIAAGSFNWLSAVRIRSGECQLKEKTRIHTGESASIRIAQELARIEEVGYGLASQKDSDRIEVTKAGRIMGLLLVLVIPTLIGNDLGNRKAGIVCTVLMLALFAMCYWQKVYQDRNEASIQ